MPRNYKRKTETKYKLQDLEKAVQEVKNKTLSLGKAAIAYDVPKSTIYDHLNKDVIKMPQTGRKAIFTKEQEKELEEHILKCSRLFYGLTMEMVRKIAFKFAEVNKLKHNFDEKTQMAGKDWFYGFKKRHPNISLRKPEATSINRISAFNRNEVKIFFENLEALQTKYQFDASRIYNVDETGISNVQRNSRILALKGQKQVGMATSGERGTTTTVVCAFSASGKYVPPFFIFKRKRMNAQLLRGGNADMVAAVSDSGWINENLFIHWLHHFISYAKPTVEEPILLVLDNHESHVSLACYLLCRQNGIVLLSLPPHTSHRMQPLDVTFFGPLKTAYNKECDLYMASNVGRRITQYEVVELFTKAFNRISNIEKAANGFRAAGIWPLDTTKFDEIFSDMRPPDDFQIAATPSMQRTVSPDAQITPTSPVQRAVTPDALIALSPSILRVVTPEAQIIPMVPVQNLVAPDDQIAPLPSLQSAVTPDMQSVVLNVQRRSVTSSPVLNTSTPLQNIVSIPQLPQPKHRQNPKKKHSIIITSTPMKDALEEKEQKRKKKAENIESKAESTNKRKRGVKNLKEFEDDTKRKDGHISRKKKNVSKRTTEDKEEYYCLICNEKYEIPIIEDWIMCYKCQRWAHENCTSGESTSRGFLCDFCACS